MAHRIDVDAQNITVANSFISTASTTFVDNTNFSIQNGVDSTKQFQFDLSGATTGTITTLVASQSANRSVTLPDSTDTLVGRATTDTLTNKTLTAPIISTISNTGTLTLPVSTDTLVGRATTDTLTNKTLTTPIISTISNTGTLTLPTSTDTLIGRATTDTLTNKTLTAPIISTISNTGILTLPTSTDTLVGRTTTDTLTNKTLTAPIISTISNTGTLTLPTSTDTLVGRATTDTLTNKTISDATNTVGANEIRTTGASVVVDTAAPPSADQVLTATSATAATWQTPSVFGQNFTNGSSDSSSSTTSGTFQQKLRVTTGSLPSGGNYYIGYCFEIGVDVKEKPGDYRVQIDDTTTILGASLFDTFDDVFHAYSGFWVGALSSGTHTIDIDYASDGGETVTIKNARIVFWRVS